MAEYVGEPAGCGWPDVHCGFCWGVEEATCESCGLMILEGCDDWRHERTCPYRGGPAVHFEEDGSERWDWSWEGRPLPDIEALVLHNEVRATYVPLPELEAWADARKPLGPLVATSRVDLFFGDPVEPLPADFPA